MTTRWRTFLGDVLDVSLSTLNVTCPNTAATAEPSLTLNPGQATPHLTLAESLVLGKEMHALIPAHSAVTLVPVLPVRLEVLSRQSASVAGAVDLRGAGKLLEGGTAIPFVASL